MTPRGVGLLGAAAALWVVARSFGVEQLQMAAVGALVLVVGSAAWCWLRPVRLELDRTISPARMWFGATAEVRLELRNAGRFPTPPATVEDLAPSSLTATTRTPLRPIRRGRRVAATYTLSGDQRGRARVGPVRLRTRDPFGVAVRTRTVPGTTEVTVYPPIWHLPMGLPLGGATTSRSDGRSRAVASGEELADVREYVRGDDLRAVHWPSTAHRGKLMVRRTESSSAPAAVLLLDRRIERHLGRGPESSFEVAVAAAASAGYHLAMRGRSLVVVDRPLDRSPKALPWELWLEQLAEVDAGPVDLGGLLRQIGDGLAGDGTLVAVVTVPDAQELRDLVRAGRGFSSRAVLVIDAAHHAGRGPDHAADTAVDALRAAGWRATMLRRGDRLDTRWRELLVSRRAATSAVGS